MRIRFDVKRDASEKRLLILQMSECSVRITILYFTDVQYDAFVAATHLAIFGEIREFFHTSKTKATGEQGHCHYTAKCVGPVDPARTLVGAHSQRGDKERCMVVGFS
jgi:hypothetical protein